MRHLFFSTIASVIFLLFTNPLHASTAKEEFVEANILTIFYHELGHAVIDLMEVPIFGQEEDAADVLSVLLMDWHFNEESAQSIAYDSAFGFINDPEYKEEITYWGLHGVDEQRYFNYICLFYGANPDLRAELAKDLELPEERAETCPEEYDQASDSWGEIFDEIQDATNGKAVTLVEGTGENSEIINRVLKEEIVNLREDFSLPETLTVSVETCDTANAFYDPENISITFCTEFVPHLEFLYDNFFDQ